VLRDRHIPDSEHPFAMGQVMPVYSEASIVRSYRLDETADYTPAEMPQVNYDINNENAKKDFTQADFCYYIEGAATQCGPAGSKLKEAKRRFEEVYGRSAFWRINVGGKVLNWETGDVLVDRVNIKTNEPPFNSFIDWLCKTFPASHECSGEDTEQEPIFMVEVMDSCVGNFLDYDGCVSQCRLIVNDTVCRISCENAGEVDCTEACSKHIPAPWYCRDPRLIDAGTFKYEFPELKRLFENTRFTSMGLQTEMNETTKVNNRLDTDLGASSIINADKFDSEIIEDRKIHYLPQGAHNKETINVQHRIRQNKTRRWQTPY